MVVVWVFVYDTPSYMLVQQHQQVSLAGWEKYHSSRYWGLTPQVYLVTWSGLWGEAMGPAIHLCYAVKVTIVMVTSVITLDIRHNLWCHQETWRYTCLCPTAKVTIIMVMSARTQMWCHQLSWVSWRTVLDSAWPNQLNDGYMWMVYHVGLSKLWTMALVIACKTTI